MLAVRSYEYTEIVCVELNKENRSMIVVQFTVINTINESETIRIIRDLPHLR